MMEAEDRRLKMTFLLLEATPRKVFFLPSPGKGRRCKKNTSAPLLHFYGWKATFLGSRQLLLHAARWLRPGVLRHRSLRSVLGFLEHLGGWSF